GNRDTAVVFVMVTPPQPDLVVSSVSVPPNVSSGQPFQVSWLVKNIGPVGSNIPEWFDQIWLSADTLLQTDQDLFLGSFPNFAFLLSNESYANQATCSLPNGLEGVFHVIVQTDATGLADESMENNNAKPVALVINLTPAADLRVEQIIVPDSALSGSPIQVVCKIKNYGTGTSNVSSWFDQVYFNQDSVLNYNFATSPPHTIRLNDLHLGSSAHNGALAPDSSYAFTLPITLPAYLSGKHYIKIYTDIHPGNDGKAFEEGNVYENSLEFNNAASVPIFIKLVPPADLQVPTVAAPGQVSPGETVPLNWMVVNTGLQITSAAGWPDGIYLSANTAFDPQTALFIRDYNKGMALEAGSGYTQSQPIKIPLNVAGPQYIHLVADRTNAVFEGNQENNNDQHSNLINVLTLDLLPAGLTIPMAASSGLSVNLSYSLKNQGQGTIYAPWSDRLFISTAPVFDAATAILIGSLPHSAPLPAGATLPVQEAFLLPNGLSGDYYVYLITNWENSVFETEVQPNNLLRSAGTLAITLASWADLQVQNPGLPTTLTAGIQVLAQWQVQNFGFGPSSSNNWKDKVWISADPTLDGSDLLLANVAHTQVLLPGANYTALAYLTLPTSYSGLYYLIFATDTDNAVYEHLTDENNNTLVVPVLVQPYPPVDLTASTVVLPSTAQSGQSIPVSWQVTNTGSAKTLGSTWLDFLWLSTDAILDANDLPVGEVL
ncbi:MAG: CARDB domain-containing protein, partial [Saprospiraceae bacterium]